MTQQTLLAYLGKSQVASPGQATTISETMPMRFTRLFWIFMFLPLRAAFAQSPDDNRSLGDIAREAREQKLLHANNVTPHSARIRELIADIGVNDADEYRGQMLELLNREDFDGLEHAAEKASSGKGRFPGGVWKLYSFYDAISQPAGGRQASDASWNVHIAIY